MLESVNNNRDSIKEEAQGFGAPMPNDRQQNTIALRPLIALNA